MPNNSANPLAKWLRGATFWHLQPWQHGITRFNSLLVRTECKQWTITLQWTALKKLNKTQQQKKYRTCLFLKHKKVAPYWICLNLVIAKVRQFRTCFFCSPKEVSVTIIFFSLLNDKGNETRRLSQWGAWHCIFRLLANGAVKIFFAVYKIDVLLILS